ncbi:hypothetical protein [Naasia sp. SYSU D00057]|uniref:hypothetical protein n=1 Tax=Naasia sp. SYSU D00057 TaxID=2817380 RepID=UPI001B312FC3|nr:hypothetical protein [Naasia sp. SYSU D00057]
MALRPPGTRLSRPLRLLRATASTTLAAVFLATLVPVPASAAPLRASGSPLPTASGESLAQALELPTASSMSAGIEQRRAAELRAAARQEERQRLWRERQRAEREIAERAAREKAEREAAEQAARQATAETAAGTSSSGRRTSGVAGSTRSSGTGGGGPVGAGGFRPGIARTVVWGDIYATQPGQVLDALDVHGRIIVRAPNVTISNSIVRGLDSGSQHGLIDAMDGHPGLRVLDTQIVATAPNHTVNGIMGSNFELHGADISNVIDGVHIAGDNVVVANSRIHGNVHYANDPSHSDGSHDDSIQIVGGSNILITGNVLVDADNVVVMIGASRSPIANVTIAGNTLDDGDCMINFSGSGEPVRGLTVRDNIFGLRSSIGHCAIVGPLSVPVTLSGNRFTDGAAVFVREG